MESQDFRARSNDTLALDGVHYADIAHAGGLWRLGATTAAWQEALMPLGPTPDAEALAQLAKGGIWLQQAADTTPPLAVMCGGMGAMWPGMGRELYDNFPAARAAMDHIQHIADWDVLALLDERELEKITATRWQIPYLFLVEYAQWAYLTSLGLAPALACGHSLGELIALCCAGVYSPETAWYALDTRAKHVAEIEAAAPSEAAMVAINAGADIVNEVLATWPELYVANHNSPTQSILCGPRDIVREARNSLRKRRIAAMMLNVSLTFHSPAMRVLRDIALRRLDALEMHAPAIPMLSVVTGEPYPDDQPGMSRIIADLDENTVQWVRTVQAMWGRHGIRHFLELGPQEILCGLVRDIEPAALCLACGRKGRETQGMRQTCAQLYALGHLPRHVLASRAANTVAQGSTTIQNTPEMAVVARPADNALPAWWQEEDCQTVLALLAQACKCEVASLRPEMDLRYDLALRSITFPHLLHEAEEKLHCTISFEDLTHVVTVGDLVAALTGRTVASEDRAATRRLWPLPVLRRYTADGTATLPYDPEGRGLPVRKGDVLAVCARGLAGETIADTLLSLAPLGVTLALPAHVPTHDLVWAGSTCTMWDGQAESLASRPTVDGLLCLGAQAGQAAGACKSLVSALLPKGLRYAACMDIVDSLPPASANSRHDWTIPVREICVATGGQQTVLNELADILAQEILRGKSAPALWAADTCLPRELAGGVAGSEPAIVERRLAYPSVWPHTASPRLPAPPVRHKGVNRYGLACAFSAAGAPSLASSLRLPASQTLLALLEAGRMFQPWLEVAGFADVRFTGLPEMRQGLAHEGHVAVTARQWMRHDGVMTRLVDTRLSLRGTTANGRHTSTWHERANATLLLAHTPAPLDATLAFPLAEQDIPRKFPLDAAWATLGIAPEGRLLSRLTPLTGKDENFFAATMHMPPWAIALDGKARYKQTLLLAEGIMQATQAWLALERKGENAVQAWRPQAVGFILLGTLDKSWGPWQICLQRSWGDACRQRFDATVVDAANNIALRLHHLEYEPFALGDAI